MTWHERITRAEAAGAFTEEDYPLARTWTHCAVAETDVPKQYLTAAPLDGVLVSLGASFCAAVGGNNVRRARELHTLIHARAEELRSGNARA